ncbi:MAG: orotidine 5'-phosphate decarboxylase, partial [Candidatus Sedimenticola endophacoides]
LGEADIAEVGYSGSPAENVLRLARLSESSGLDGIVCSPLEAGVVRGAVGPEFKLITPGVRPVFASSDDQRRIMTPADALRGGADYLVIGRPITAAADPLRALRLIQEEIAAC